MTVDVRGYARAVGQAAGPRLDHGDRSVLAWITMFANANDASTFVSVGKLATVTGLHPGNVRRHLGRLVGAGYLIADSRPGRSTLFRLPCGAPEDIHTPRASARGVRAPARDVNSQGTVLETLPPIHVANGFAAAADDTGEFELAPEIYARIGHHMPKARPKGSA